MGAVRKIAKKLIYHTLPASHIMMFHHITAQPDVQKSGCLIDHERFKEIVLRYKDHYATLDEVVKGKKKNKIAITFDDGLSDLYTMAYPFLKEHSIPFTAFILTDMLDTPGYITTEQLQSLSKDPLVTVGSHGVTHRIFTELSYDQKVYELAESKKILQKLTGREIEYFAYSHGQYNKETLKLVKKQYEYAVSTKGFPLNILTGRKYLLPRLNIEEETYGRFIKLLDETVKKTKRKG